MNLCHQKGHVQIANNNLCPITVRIALDQILSVIHAVFPYIVICPSIVCRCGMDNSSRVQIYFHMQSFCILVIFQTTALWLHIRQRLR